MCAVRHTAGGPSALRLAQLGGGGGFFDPPPCTRSAPPSRGGGGGGARPGPPRGGLETISECGDAPAAGGSSGSRALAERGEPWRSPAVADFASRLGEDARHQPMVLQGPRGLALKALGEAADHEVATRAVADIEVRRQKSLPPGPSADAAETRLLRDRRNAVRRGTDLALTSSAAIQLASRPQATFGAVYEYRDACGTPRVVASTSAAPERQFALDQMRYEGALQRVADPALVWVGVSGGGGRLDEADMAEVRRSVASHRAERLQAQKLADIKPYSRHG